jgi:hypothetical protein
MFFFTQNCGGPEYAIIKMVRAAQALKRDPKMVQVEKQLMINKLGKVSNPLDNVLFHSL